MKIDDLIKKLKEIKKEWPDGNLEVYYNNYPVYYDLDKPINYVGIRYSAIKPGVYLMSMED